MLLNARFVSEDSYEGTLNNPLSHNLYTYTWNNPLTYSDPSGHSPVTAIPRVVQGAWALARGILTALGAGASIALNEQDGKVRDFTVPVPMTVEESQTNRRKNDKITLHHATKVTGTASILANGIDVTYGREYLDFGQAFYITNDIEQAEDWIFKKFKGYGDILVFQVDEEIFAEYEGKTFHGNTKAWRTFVYDNRVGPPSHVKEYDYVEGPYLANPKQVYNRSKYIAEGHQVAIRHPNLAAEIFQGYVGSIPIRN